jgi:hypothetical protein
MGQLTTTLFNKALKHEKGNLNIIMTILVFSIATVVKITRFFGDCRIHAEIKLQYLI